MTTTDPTLTPYQTAMLDQAAEQTRAIRSILNFLLAATLILGGVALIAAFLLIGASA